MDIRPLTMAEWKYTYTQDSQIQGQTGSIGHLRGDFGKEGNSFYCSFFDHRKQWKTDEFKSGLDKVINALRSEEYGLLQNRTSMIEYASLHPDSILGEGEKEKYGFRADLGRHAYLFRCSPAPGDYNFYCYCYVKEWLDRHIQEAKKGIRFIDSGYHELFRIADGEKITITNAEGEKSEHICRYIDESHTEIGDSLYHICQFAEFMEQNGAVYTPVKPEMRDTEKKGQRSEDEEQNQEKKTEMTLEFKTRFGTAEQVMLEAGAYQDSKSLYVGMTTVDDGFPEPYGNVTVNLPVPVPSYCAFVDTNNMPELEDFLVKNGIAEFTGLMQQSGYCTYPLYLFDAEKMRGLCPDGMAAYEQANRLDKKQVRKEMSR